MTKNVRVLCEGISDFESIREIFKKENIQAGVRNFKGKDRLKTKVNKYVRNFGGKIDIFIIVIDSHCTDPSLSYEEVYNSIEESNIESVRIHVIKHALESWFLAEMNAINQRYRKRFRFPSNPEGICKPDKELEDILRRAGRLKYHKSVDAKAISKLLDTEDLKNRNSNFNSFIELVHQAQQNS